MRPYKQPPFTLAEHEMFSCEILDLLLFQKETPPHLSLKQVCKQNGLSYEWVHKQAETSGLWCDLVFMYEGLKSGWE